jgi:hypothetical protein
MCHELITIWKEAARENQENSSVKIIGNPAKIRNGHLNETNVKITQVLSLYTPNALNFQMLLLLFKVMWFEAWSQGHNMCSHLEKSSHFSVRGVTLFFVVFLAQVRFSSLVKPDRARHSSLETCWKMSVGKTWSGFGTQRFPSLASLKGSGSGHRFTCDIPNVLPPRTLYGSYHTLWQVPQTCAEKIVYQWHLVAYCQFPLLKYCLIFMDAENILSPPLSCISTASLLRVSVRNYRTVWCYVPIIWTPGA